MNDLQSELNELKQFIADLKADRATAKDKERREGWTKYVSLTIVIVAVFAAIATQWSGKYSGRTLAKLNDATFYQAKASDQWAFYQAKSIKQNLYEVSRGSVALTGQTNDPAVARQLADFDRKVAKYEEEKAGIKQEAEGLEKQRDSARSEAAVASKKGGDMGLSVSFFSISIAMASICLVTKKKPLWFVAMLLAALAVTEMVLVWTR